MMTTTQADDIERIIARDLYELSRMLGERNPEAQARGLLGGEWGYGQHFKSDVFEMHPFYWGECECGADERIDAWFEANGHSVGCSGSPCSCGFAARHSEMASVNPHAPECPEGWPNFRHRRTGFEVDWYKWIGRGMSLSRDVSVEEWAAIAAECMGSLR
jgi:hypothetical protein